MPLPTNFFSQPPNQGPVGRNPEGYIAELPLSKQLIQNYLAMLPAQGRQPLSRGQLLGICKNHGIDDLVAYACVMAWGGRDFRNYRLTLEPTSLMALRPLLRHLRKNTQNRHDAFAHTQNAAQGINGLNISFYTKLLFFLRSQQDAYILDQWTAKSAVLWNPAVGVRLTSAGLPRPDTAPDTYETYCAWLDHLAKNWGPPWVSGEQVEQALFDSPNGLWRKFVKRCFPPKIRNMNRPAQLPPPKKRRIPRMPASKSNPKTLFVHSLDQAFQQALQQRRTLPGDSVTFHDPNRGFCQSAEGVVWQFTVSKAEVNAQVFFNKSAVPKYGGLVGKLKPSTKGKTHVFQQGAVGNGPRAGKTRSINLAVTGGYGSTQADWPRIANEAVEALETLFNYLGPHL